MHTFSVHFSRFSRVFTSWCSRAGQTRPSGQPARVRANFSKDDTFEIIDSPLSGGKGISVSTADSANPSSVACSAAPHPTIKRTAPQATARRHTQSVQAPVSQARPHVVRVLRARDGSTERLALVGRMADVCAELDRLVARERLC